MVIPVFSLLSGLCSSIILRELHQAASPHQHSAHVTLPSLPTMGTTGQLTPAGRKPLPGTHAKRTGSGSTASVSMGVAHNCRTHAHDLWASAP